MPALAILLTKIGDLFVSKIQNGQICQLWDDNWMDMSAKLKFPELYSFARNKVISMSAAREHA
jgi:hypothetical protein